MALVGSHPQLAEKLAAQLVQRRLVQEVGDFSATESQKTFGNTRVDYVLRYEVKGVTSCIVCRHADADAADAHVQWRSISICMLHCDPACMQARRPCTIPSTTATILCCSMLHTDTHVPMMMPACRMAPGCCWK